MRPGRWTLRRSATHGRSRLATLWNAVTAAVGAVMGLLPHLLHHVSIFAGAVLVTGVGGNLLFGALGLLLSVPLLRRLYRPSVAPTQTRHPGLRSRSTPSTANTTTNSGPSPPAPCRPDADPDVAARLRIFKEPSPNPSSDLDPRERR